MSLENLPPLSLRIATIHCLNTPSLSGKLWKEIFMPFSSYTFLVQHGTEQFWGMIAPWSHTPTIWKHRMILPPALDASFPRRSPQIDPSDRHFGIRCILPYDLIVLKFGNMNLMRKQLTWLKITDRIVNNAWKSETRFFVADSLYRNSPAINTGTANIQYFNEWSALRN